MMWNGFKTFLLFFFTATIIFRAEGYSYHGDGGCRDRKGRTYEPGDKWIEMELCEHCECDTEGEKIGFTCHGCGPVQAPDYDPAECYLHTVDRPYPGCCLPELCCRGDSDFDAAMLDAAHQLTAKAMSGVPGSNRSDAGSVRGDRVWVQWSSGDKQDGHKHDNRTAEKTHQGTHAKDGDDHDKNKDGDHDDHGDHAQMDKKGSGQGDHVEEKMHQGHNGNNGDEQGDHGEQSTIHGKNEDDGRDDNRDLAETLHDDKELGSAFVHNQEAEETKNMNHVESHVSNKLGKKHHISENHKASNHVADVKGNFDAHGDSYQTAKRDGLKHENRHGVHGAKYVYKKRAPVDEHGDNAEHKASKGRKINLKTNSNKNRDNFDDKQHDHENSDHKGADHSHARGH